MRESPTLRRVLLLMNGRIMHVNKGEILSFWDSDCIIQCSSKSTPTVCIIVSVSVQLILAVKSPMFLILA